MRCRIASVFSIASFCRLLPEPRSCRVRVLGERDAFAINTEDKSLFRSGSAVDEGLRFFASLWLPLRLLLSLRLPFSLSLRLAARRCRSASLCDSDASPSLAFPFETCKEESIVIEEEAADSSAELLDIFIPWADELDVAALVDLLRSEDLDELEEA